MSLLIKASRDGSEIVKVTPQSAGWKYVGFAAYRLVLLPSFPSTHALFGDWYNHAVFATVFLFGFVLAHAAAEHEPAARQ